MRVSPRLRSGNARLRSGCRFDARAAVFMLGVQFLCSGCRFDARGADLEAQILDNRVA
jgi:hypothetical protein